ncbi:MAG TPA: hypothetical protein PLH15_02055 [Spirochaetota bacterium]|nr:hypothetical protein [Spirochaetota bacterium]HQO22183.1 hypothetical protein [Spirochaetota bacterium]HQQ22608.1 hypothetical protein [Spirochaetota bacterium]
MAFKDEFNTLFEKCDFDGALSLLSSIFNDPENQKPKPTPTDFLHSEDDEKLLGVQFEQLVSQFIFNLEMRDQFDFVVEMLNNSRNEKSDNNNFFQPFNAFVFSIGYSTIVTSFHYDLETNTLSRQYGLNHEALGEYQMDSFYEPESNDQVQSFKFAVENGKYDIRCGKEILDGKMITDMIDRVLIARFLRDEFIPAFIRYEGFAQFPKALPFRFFLSTKSGSEYEKYISDGSFFEIHPAMTEELVRSTQLADVYKKSTEPGKPVYPDDHLCFYINFLQKDRLHLPGFSKLCEIIINEQDAFDVIANIGEMFLAGQMLSNGENNQSELFRKVYSAFQYAQITDFLIIFRALGDRDSKYKSLASNFSERFMRISSPSLDENPDNAVRQAETYVKETISMYELLSQEQQMTVYDAYNEKINELMSHSSAIYRTLAYETEIRRLQEKMPQAVGTGDEGRIAIIMRDYAKSVSDLLPLMPDKFNMYTPLWYFVMPRVKGLGAKEPSVIPGLLSLFEKYSAKDGCDRERVSATIGVMLINAGLIEIPSALENVFHQIMSEEKEYAEWRDRVPKEKFAQFISVFESDIDSLRNPSVWEAYIHDALYGDVFFRKQIDSHPQKKVIFELLLEAAEKGPGPRMVKLISKILNVIITTSDDDEPFHETAQKIIALLKHVPNPSAKLLVQAKLVIAAYKIINGEKDAGECLSAFAHQRNDFPMIAVFETANEIYVSGIEKAIRLFFDRWKEICGNDSRYFSEFCLVCGTNLENPETINIPRAYAVFSSAYREYSKMSALVPHKYADRFNMVCDDPVKKIIPEILSDLEKNGGLEIVEPLLLEYNIRKEIEQSSREDLHRIIDSCNEAISQIIIEHLRPNAGSYCDEYMALLKHFKNDMTQYNNTIMRLWPISQIHEKLLDSLVDHPGLPDLPDFIYCYIGGSDLKITGEIFKHLQSRGFHDAVIHMAGGLSVHRLIPFIESVVSSWVASVQYAKAVEWFARLRDGVKPNHPNYVFLTNRIAVFQMLNSDNESAEKTYTDLFSIDWRAFTGERSEMDKLSDDMMDEVMGGSLDRELIDQFNVSFASAHYNMACLMGKKGDSCKAVDELALAVRFNPKGYPSSMIDADRDFDSIRSSEDFCAFMKNIN